mmetsp:Transcript_40091/g.100341  ORF Transcript_40091/g.100341 Transcript_40091/m.100341 type:complete len:211 (-) Transcript_40091:137-769(-)
MAGCAIPKGDRSRSRPPYPEGSTNAAAGWSAADTMGGGSSKVTSRIDSSCVMAGRAGGDMGERGVGGVANNDEKGGEMAVGDRGEAGLREHVDTSNPSSTILSLAVGLPLSCQGIASIALSSAATSTPPSQMSRPAYPDGSSKLPIGQYSIMSFSARISTPPSAAGAFFLIALGPLAAGGLDGLWMKPWPDGTRCTGGWARQCGRRSEAL